MTDITRLPRQTHHVSKQALWFLVVGAAAAGVHFTVLVIIVSTTAMTPAWANVMAFLVAFIVSFLGHFYLTFKHRTPAIDRAINNVNNKRAEGSNSAYHRQPAVCTDNRDDERTIPCHNPRLSRLRQSSDTSTPYNHTTNSAKRLIQSPTKTTLPWQALLKWFVSSALGFMANQALFVTGLHWFGARYYMLIWIVITGVITVMTFTLGKLWAFKS